VLCLLLAMWVTALVLVELPGTIAIAERVVPPGMLQAGAHVHAGTNVIGGRSRVGWFGYGQRRRRLTGAIWPRGYYGPGIHGAGPTVAGDDRPAIGAIAVNGWLFREIWRNRHARRQIRLLASGTCSDLGGWRRDPAACDRRRRGPRYTAPALLGAVVPRRGRPAQAGRRGDRRLWRARPRPPCRRRGPARDRACAGASRRRVVRLDAFVVGCASCRSTHCAR
jgi:hypothetical protein